MFCAEMTSERLIRRNLSWKTRASSVSLFLRPAKQALHLHSRARRQFQHCIRLRYAAEEQRRARGCNSPQGAINAMQHGWLANSRSGIERVRIVRMERDTFVHRRGRRITVRLFLMLRAPAAVPHTDFDSVATWPLVTSGLKIHHS